MWRISIKFDGEWYQIDKRYDTREEAYAKVNDWLRQQRANGKDCFMISKVESKGVET